VRVRQDDPVTVPVPEVLRHSMTGAEGGLAWLDDLPERVRRAVDRWDLTLGEPFTSGMSAWAAPGTTGAARPVVLKLSYPHSEAREEGRALRVWGGNGAVELLDADDDDWALLLDRLEPGSTLAEAALDPAAHVRVGAGVLARMGTVAAGDDGFDRLSDAAAALADLAEERLARLAPAAPVPIDVGLCREAVDLLRTLPGTAPTRRLLHGDLNPGNILLDERRSAVRWVAIDPKPLVGDPAWDPWPLLTQVGRWTDAPSATELAERTGRFADLSGVDAWRIAAWAVARSVESALWAADRGWWTGERGADGDLARAGAWSAAASALA
jgi:streptomycin 6-kinase